MPHRTGYAPGTPNWVDLQTTDTQAAKAFYAGLLGWQYDDQPIPQGGAPQGALFSVIQPAPPPSS